MKITLGIKLVIFNYYQSWKFKLFMPKMSEFSVVFLLPEIMYITPYLLQMFVQEVIDGPNMEP